jgi:DNA-binding transcriptional regulator of glucitol operon
VVRDQAYAWYRDQAASTGLVDDKGTAVVGDVSARYSDPAAAALLVRKNETVFTLLYTLNATTTSTTPQPIIALEALARLLASRF